MLVIWTQESGLQEGEETDIKFEIKDSENVTESDDDRTLDASTFNNRHKGDGAGM